MYFKVKCFKLFLKSSFVLGNFRGDRKYLEKFILERRMVLKLFQRIENINISCEDILRLINNLGNYLLFNDIVNVN